MGDTEIPFILIVWYSLQVKEKKRLVLPVNHFFTKEQCESKYYSF